MMVISVRPTRCVICARWLSLGRFNSVAWLPFLNCARAGRAPANTVSETATISPQKLRIGGSFVVSTNSYPAFVLLGPRLERTRRNAAVHLIGIDARKAKP